VSDRWAAHRLKWLGLACAIVQPVTGASDSRLRSVPYSNDEIYRLHGYAGYQIDLEFDSGESFVGLGSGDVEGLAFEAQGNHLFIKPKAVNVRTNLTVLTTRHTYHIDYVASIRAEAGAGDVIYALRFEYPKPPPMLDKARVSSELSLATTRVRNYDYWYCGRQSLQPLQAWDDGIHTHLRFNPRMELPALFVRNDDASESLVNFTVDLDEIVIHRIARQFIVRRGKMTGCIVNRSFSGYGQPLDSGTLSPSVERATRTPPGQP
jgi:type IV secretion system protein VirB9